MSGVIERKNMKEPFVLNDAFKCFKEDQDKTLTPRETVDNFNARAEASGMDILQETRRVDTGRLGIPVYSSICGQDARMMTGTAKQMGKGATPVQAEASAVMELTERFSFYGFSANPANFVVDRMAGLKDRAVSFNVLAKSVADTSGQVEAVGRFFADIPLRWTAAWNITRGERVMIPFDWFFAINQFNGSCAGNCNEEALCQGICEVVERHVSCIVGRGRLVTPGIRPESADHPAVTEMRAKYQTAGVQVFLSDFTLDYGPPTVGVLAYDPVTFPDKSEIVWTAGTAPDPQKAMSRALTEAAQLGGDFNTGACFVESGLPKFKQLEEAAFITQVSPELSIRDLPDLSHDNIRVEIENCLSALADRNMDVYIIDMTDPLLKLPAFYVIIPGARFFQRAENASTGMFTAKLITENFPLDEAITRLTAMRRQVGPAYYIDFFLGQCHFQKDEPDTALTLLYRALEQDPAGQDVASIYSYIGQTLKAQEKYKEALAAVEKGLLADNERIDLLNLAGFCFFKLGEHEQAIERFAAVLEIDPSSAIDYANIAVNYRQLGDNAKAICFYQQALTIDPTIEFARQHLEAMLNKAPS